MSQYVKLTIEQVRAMHEAGCYEPDPVERARLLAANESPECEIENLTDIVADLLYQIDRLRNEGHRCKNGCEWCASIRFSR